MPPAMKDLSSVRVSQAKRRCAASEMKEVRCDACSYPRVVDILLSSGSLSALAERQTFTTARKTQAAEVGAIAIDSSVGSGKKGEGR